MDFREVRFFINSLPPQSARSALSGGAAARMIAAEVSTKNPFFSLRGPAKALHTASAEGASYFKLNAKKNNKMRSKFTGGHFMLP